MRKSRSTDAWTQLALAAIPVVALALDIFPAAAAPYAGSAGVNQSGNEVGVFTGTSNQISLDTPGGLGVAAFDFAGGLLRADAAGALPSSGQTELDTTASASIMDTITSNITANIQYTFMVVGILNVAAQPIYGGGPLIYNSSYVTACVNQDCQSSFLGYGFSGNGAAEEGILEQVTGYLPLVAGVGYSIDLQLIADAVGDAFSDFFNTGYLTWTIPQGVEITSASGVFMTDPVSSSSPDSIPEPGSVVLLAFGLVAVSLVRAPRLGRLVRRSCAH